MLTKTRLAFTLLTGLCLLAMNAGSARAASILWTSTTGAPISGDANVSTAGSLIGAFDLGATGVPGATVNGVNFAAFPVVGSPATVGNFTLTFAGVSATNTNFGSVSGPFSALSAGYQALLKSGIAGGGSITLTMGGLALGQNYTFQWWSNDSFPTYFPYVTAATSGNSVSLNSNSLGINGVGGLGSFATGTFTADSTSQVITFSGDVNHPIINAFQLRQTSIPLPPAVWSGLATLTTLATIHLLRRRRSQ